MTHNGINTYMRALLILCLLATASCNRCYECERTVSRTSDKPFPGYPVAAVSKFSVTKEQAEAFNGLLVIERDTINGVVLTTNIKTVCGKN